MRFLTRLKKRKASATQILVEVFSCFKIYQIKNQIYVNLQQNTKKKIISKQYKVCREALH